MVYLYVFFIVYGCLEVSKYNSRKQNCKFESQN